MDAVSLQQFIQAEDMPQVGEVSFLMPDSKFSLELNQIFQILITRLCFHALASPLASGRVACLSQIENMKHHCT